LTGDGSDESKHCSTLLFSIEVLCLTVRLVSGSFIATTTG